MTVDNLTLYNPYIEYYQIINNNVDINSSKKERYEINISDFNKLIDISKYSIPNFLNENPNLIFEKEENNININQNQNFSFLKKKSSKMKILSNTFLLKSNNVNNIFRFDNPKNNENF